MSLSNKVKKLSNSSGDSVYVCTYESPVGKVITAADDDFLYIVTFEDTRNYEISFELLAQELSCKFIEAENKVLQSFKEQLSDYFSGKLKKFTVPIKTFGSNFQKEVWNKLMELPYGSTQTYGELAGAIGRPLSHSRAVGAACGANFLLLVVPCHRLVAAGSKGGYNSGVDRKAKLIELEKSHTM